MFYIYVLFLILGGIAMLVMASVKTGQTTTRRAWNAVFGAGFTVYGLYLLLFFHSGHYLIFFYVFLLPIFMIVRFFRDRSAFQARQEATAFQGPHPGYGQPSSYGQPSEDQPAKGAPRMRCLECGAETAEAARFCAQCGAPVIRQPSAADPAAGGPGDSTRLPDELVGQRAGHRSRRNAPIIIGAGFAALAAAIAAIALAGSTSPSRSSASPNPPASRASASPSRASASPSRASASPSPPASSAPSVGQLTRDQLQPGDCLQVPGINTISQWPGVFTAVPCARPHTGEVFFAGNIWPQSLAYPGDQPVNDQAEARCDRSFARYVGIPVDQSAYTYAWDMPDDGSWAIGDRSVQCIAYHPGGASVNVSIKRSKR